MKSNRALKTLTTALVLFGSVMSGLPISGRAGKAAAAYALPTYQTTLNIRGVNEQTGKIEAIAQTQDFPINNGGISFARHFQSGANHFLLMVRKHTGDAYVRQVLTNGQQGAATDFKNLEQGWTAVDYFTYAGVTYRAVFKAAGDPYQSGPEDNDQLHRLVIQKVNADGVTGENIFDGALAYPWSSVRFVEMPGGLFAQHKLLFYNNWNGHYQTYAFDPVNGLGALTATGAIENGYTDLETMTVSEQTFLVGLNEENAKPFSPAKAETMGMAIHEGLKNKAVGYQFLLMQSGKVIYSRAHGYSRLSQRKIAMNIRTRLDLGSVGKLMTTMTTMKLAEQRKVYLYKPIADQIDPVKYPAPHDWTKQRKLIDLMKQTTGMKERESADCDGIKDTFEVTCKDFFTASPTLDCVNGLCQRSYNNANFGALRQVIENVSGTKTTAELVNLTFDLWARKIHFDGATCSDQKDVYGFNDCNGADNCVEYNGVWWQEVQGANPYSKSCGAGGWHASARQMGEFMSAARYSKALTLGLNQIFMSTEHEALVNGAQSAGATALGWDPAWTVEDGGEKLLRKGGASDGERAYVTQLPNRMDAVLLVNTALANHPEELLRGAYKYAVGETTTPPVYVEIRPTISVVSDKVTDLSIGSINAKVGQHVTAMRDSAGNLKVAGWMLANDGSVTSGQAVTAGAISDVSVTDGQAFLTAVRNGSGNLQVTSWSATVGSTVEVKREADVTLGPISKVVATKLSGAGTLLGRFATAVRNGGNNLQLDVWDANNWTKDVTRKDSYVAGPISEVAFKTLIYSLEAGQTTRFATAARNGDGELQVDVWDVFADGQIQRRGGGVGSTVSNSSGMGNRIAIGAWEGGNFFTASIDGSGELDITSWSVTGPTGIVSKKDDYHTGGVLEVAIASNITLVRLKSDIVMKLVYFKFDSNGKILRYGDFVSEDANQIAATGSLVTAVRLRSDKADDNDKLKLVKWLVVE